MRKARAVLVDGDTARYSARDAGGMTELVAKGEGNAAARRARALAERLPAHRSPPRGSRASRSVRHAHAAEAAAPDRGRGRLRRSARCARLGREAEARRPLVGGEGLPPRRRRPHAARATPVARRISAIRRRSSRRPMRGSRDGSAWSAISRRSASPGTSRRTASSLLATMTPAANRRPRREVDRGDEGRRRRAARRVARERRRSRCSCATVRRPARSKVARSRRRSRPRSEPRLADADAKKLHDVMEDITKARGDVLTSALVWDEPQGLSLRAPVRDADSAARAVRGADRAREGGSVQGALARSDVTSSSEELSGTRKGIARDDHARAREGHARGEGPAPARPARRRRAEARSGAEARAERRPGARVGRRRRRRSRSRRRTPVRGVVHASARALHRERSMGEEPAIARTFTALGHHDEHGCSSFSRFASIRRAPTCRQRRSSSRSAAKTRTPRCASTSRTGCSASSRAGRWGSDEPASRTVKVQLGFVGSIAEGGRSRRCAALQERGEVCGVARSAVARPPRARASRRPSLAGSRSSSLKRSGGLRAGCFVEDRERRVEEVAVRRSRGGLRDEGTRCHPTVGETLDLQARDAAFRRATRGHEEDRARGGAERDRREDGARARRLHPTHARERRGERRALGLDQREPRCGCGVDETASRSGETAGAIEEELACAPTRGRARTRRRARRARRGSYRRRVRHDELPRDEEPTTSDRTPRRRQGTARTWASEVRVGITPSSVVTRTSLRHPRRRRARVAFASALATTTRSPRRGSTPATVAASSHDARTPPRARLASRSPPRSLRSSRRPLARVDQETVPREAVDHRLHTSRDRRGARRSPRPSSAVELCDHRELAQRNAEAAMQRARQHRAARAPLDRLSRARSYVRVDARRALTPRIGAGSVASIRTPSHDRGEEIALEPSERGLVVGEGAHRHEARRRTGRTLERGARRPPEAAAPLVVRYAPAPAVARSAQRCIVRIAFIFRLRRARRVVSTEQHLQERRARRRELVREAPGALRAPCKSGVSHRTRRPAACARSLSCATLNGSLHSASKSWNT